ncbi:MAG: T9SS type A sorting domain-containing protein [Paludibacter sp.]|nr:T9SS type A sorting domain-containing protein [Paludibacter sp.]
MKKQTLLLLCLLGTFFTTLNAQIDTVGVYYLTDGGGDPSVKSAYVYASDAVFTDYTRVGVTPSSGSGFFVSKGFPFGGADYDEGKYHTFTVTPQNDATLYIKKFSMSHKRSGSNPNPGNTVNFKCVVQYEDKEYVFGTGTTINPTAWFYADNLKILTKSPVTFKLYAKDLYDASQSWMQRRVSLIGATIPSGVDPEEIIGPLDPTYTEVLQDYVNPLSFFKIEAEGQLTSPYIYDMSGMPLSYMFIVNNDVNLAEVKFNYHLPKGTTLQAPIPSDFSSVSKHTVVLQSSWGTRKVVINVKKINAASSEVDLKFDNTNTFHQWDKNTVGWVDGNVSSAENTTIQFDKEDAAFVIATQQAKRSLAFDINKVETTSFKGMFSVETSSDGIKWDYLYHFNSCNPVPSITSSYSTELNEGVRYVRFVYDCQNDRQKINVNNILLGGDFSAVNNIKQDTKFKIFPNPANTFFNIESSDELKELVIFSTTGVLIKRVLHPGSSITVDDIQKGIYLCKMFSNSGYSITMPLTIK